MQQSYQMLKGTAKNYFYPYQLVDVINHKNKNVVLIDIRNKYAFGLGHIPGARSIPSFNLTRKENLKLLKGFKKNGITVILYADNQLHANGPWMFFRQVGFNNIKILLGGYDYFLKHRHNLAATRNDNSYLKGIARFDYAKVAKSTKLLLNNAQKNNGKKPVIFKRRKKVAVASGGC